MKKPFVVTTALALALGATGIPAHAQYTNPHTGNVFNNPTSSLIDTMILNKGREMMMSNSINSSMASSMAAVRSRIMRAGAEKIKRGRASTHFTRLSPFNTEEWITRCGAKTPEVRRQYAAEIATQREIWAQEVRARGANPDDMAEMLAIAFVLAWEPHSGGQKATDAQYRWVMADFRKSLLKDPYFQGMSAADKQYLFENNLIGSTDTVRQWREGAAASNTEMQQAGRRAASKFLDSWWEGPVENLIATPTGFADKPGARK